MFRLFQAKKIGKKGLANAKMNQKIVKKHEDYLNEKLVLIDSDEDIVKIKKEVCVNYVFHFCLFMIQKS